MRNAWTKRGAILKAELYCINAFRKKKCSVDENIGCEPAVDLRGFGHSPIFVKLTFSQHFLKKKRFPHAAWPKTLTHDKNKMCL